MHEATAAIDLQRAKNLHNGRSGAVCLGYNQSIQSITRFKFLKWVFLKVRSDYTNKAKSTAVKLRRKISFFADQ